MNSVGWTLDLARDQRLDPARLAGLCERSLRAGFSAIGLYLEHRLAYSSAPFAAAPGALTTHDARRLSRHYGALGLRVVPFLNTLGHMEGFIRSEGGQSLAESSNIWSLQTCPTRAECRKFVRGLMDDALDVFDDEWVHLGGDEAYELGNCPECAPRAASIGKAGLYGEHYRDLCGLILERGRRPCIWGDMLLQHPEAMSAIPKQTLIFDWQYFNRPLESTRRFRNAGFDVVCCPSVQTYNSGWCFLDATRTNIDEHAADAKALGAVGVWVTTWEFTFFSNLGAAIPIVMSAGRRLTRGQEWRAALIEETDVAFERAAEILGCTIPAASAFLKPGGWRTLRDRFVIRQNPFELWKAWRSEACGPIGDTLLRHCAEARNACAASTSRDAREFDLPLALHESAIHWVRAAEAAYREYVAGKLERCALLIDQSGSVLDALLPPLQRIAAEGGSAADPQRLARLREKLNKASERIRQLSPSASWRPSFETLTHDNYIAGDQAAWKTSDAFVAPAS